MAAMESRWYFFAGQNSGNTAISDRAHALHITRGAWAGITQHLDRKKRVQEALDREEAHKRALGEGSKAMTKEWKDSIENIRRRKEQERMERLLGQRKDDKIEQYYTMRKEQEAVRKEFVEKVKRRIFVSSDYPKNLTSALILAETLHERDGQRRFDRKVKQKEREMQLEYEQSILDRDKEDIREDEERKRKKFEEERELGRVLREQIAEKENDRRESLRSHIERETRDRIRAAEEERLLQEYEKEEKLKKIRQCKEEKREELEVERRMRQQARKEEEEFEKAAEFYSKAKYRIECMKKAKEKEMKEEMLAHHERMAAAVAREQEDKESAENARLAKAVAEGEEKETRREREKEELQEMARKMRIEDRRQYLKRQESEQKILAESKRWEMLNRIKALETMHEYDDLKKKDRWAKTLRYRQELLEQMAEDRQRMREEEELDQVIRNFSIEKDKNINKMFFDYANEVLDYAKSRNRSTYPIEQVIQAYKKEFRLDTKKVRRCTKHGCPIDNHPVTKK